MMVVEAGVQQYFDRTCLAIDLDREPFQDDSLLLHSSRLVVRNRHEHLAQNVSELGARD